MSIPSSSPDTTMERAVARLWGGASSPTSGSTIGDSARDAKYMSMTGSILSCGVTVVKAVRNDRKLKTGNESVMQRPILDSSPSDQPCQGNDGIFGSISPHSSRKPTQKQYECSSPEQIP